MALDHQKMDRLSIWMISIIGIVILFGGILQIRSRLYDADRSLFAEARQLYAVQQNTQAEAQGVESPSEKSLLELQSEDTDGDTISDFDELYVHTTSPYLADSDSDGVNDAEELAADEDPNCPTGATCEQQRSSGSQTATAAEQAFSEFNPDNTLPLDTNGDVDMDQLRQILTDQGVPQELLDQTSDEDLVEIFEESSALVEQGGNAIVNVKEQADQIRALSTDEKRKFLLETGVPQAEIDALTDEQVEQLVNQSVDEALQAVLQQDIVPNNEVQP